MAKIIFRGKFSDENRDIIVDFIKEMKVRITIEKLPKIYLHKDAPPEGVTTGAFMPSQDVIHVRCRNRLLVDILRTLAHELTHHRQFERGDEERIQAEPDDIFAWYENEAYINAGNIVKDFCRKYGKVEKEKLYQLFESKNIKGA